jgi:hypothetical protein
VPPNKRMKLTRLAAAPGWQARFRPGAREPEWTASPLRSSCAVLGGQDREEGRMLRRCIEQARVMQEEGAVVVELGLSASGHPTEAKVETSAGADLDAVFRGPMER